MSAVQPVWWLAPRPRPVAPSKYSWNSSRSSALPSGWPGASGPRNARRPCSSRRNNRSSRPADLVRRLADRDLAPGLRRERDPELGAVVAVERAQRLQEEVVDRPPDRPSPVGVAAERARPRLRRFVAHAMGRPAQLEHERPVVVHGAHRPDAVIGQELVRIEEPGEQRLQPMAADQGEQSARAHAGRLPRRHERRERRAIPQEPAQAALELRQCLEQLGLQGLDGEQGHQSDERPDLELDELARVEMQHVVEERVVLIPQGCAVACRRR